MTDTATLADRFTDEVASRIDLLQRDARAGAYAPAVDLMVETIAAGGVLQAFGTGHSEAFAMEIAGRAGGLIPTNKIALRDVVLRGPLGVEVLGGGTLERDPEIAQRIWDSAVITPGDLFLIASNSGVNGSIVGMALLAKEHGHRVIAVTSMDHTARVEPKHPSGQRLRDVADIAIDNLAPYGDAAIDRRPADVPVGSRVLDHGGVHRAAAHRRRRRAASSRAGSTPPLYLSANIPGGDDHNHALEERYGERIRRGA